MKLGRTSKAVPSGGQFRYSCTLKGSQHLIEGGTCLLFSMLWEPTRDIRSCIPSWSESFYRDGITIEVIRNNGLH